MGDRKERGRHFVFDTMCVCVCERNAHTAEVFHELQSLFFEYGCCLLLLVVTYLAVCVYGRQRRCPSALLHIIIHLVCKVFGFRVARMSQPKPSVCLSSDDRRLRVTFTQSELFPHFRGTEDTSSFLTYIFSMLSFCCKIQLIKRLTLNLWHHKCSPQGRFWQSLWFTPDPMGWWYRGVVVNT